MDRRLGRILISALAVLLLVAGVTLLPSHPALAASPTATFTKTQDWGSGYEGRYVIDNPGPATITAWTVQFDLASNVGVNTFWDADLTRSGSHYTFTNKSYNGTIAPGGSTSFGFNGPYSGTFSPPANCLLNGQPCGGGPATSSTSTATSTTAPPSSTTTTTMPSTTTTTSGTTTTTTGGGNPGPLTRVAYFAQWGIYQRSYFVKNIETSGSASKLSVVNYAFANIHPTDLTCFEANKAAGGDTDPNAGAVAGDAFADYQKGFDAATSVDGVADSFDQPLKGNFNQLKKLKARHPNLKALISIGGWSYSKFFSDAALTAASRSKLVSSCIDMFIRGNLPQLSGDPAGGTGAAAGVFDGIDLDWEWPASDGHLGNHVRAEDKHNFTLLAAEFRRQLDALGAQTGKHYLLTAFLPADPAKISEGVEPSGLLSSLDWATVQGYDLHGAWEPTTNHQSALFSPSGDPSPQKFSVDLAISTYRNAGAPGAKLLVGVPFYSRGWAGVTNQNNGLFQQSTGCAAGTFACGYEDYKKVTTFLASGFALHRDSSVGTAWLFNGSTFWTFDDPTAMAQKVAYVKNKGLGGVMMWSLDGDTPNGELISALDTALR